MTQGVPQSNMLQSIMEQWQMGDLANLQEEIIRQNMCNGKFVGTHALQVSLLCFQLV